MIRYICRHIIRAPAKSLLSMAVALFFTLALGMLQVNITSLEAEIDRIYAETVVNAEIQLCPHFKGDRVRRAIGDIVPRPIMQSILDTGVPGEVYLEGGSMAFLAGVSNSPFSVIDEPGGMDILVGTAELRHFTEEPDGFIARDSSFNMEIHFAEGFDEHSFLCTDMTAIPLVISRELSERRGLSPGDHAHIVYYRPILFHTGDWLYAQALVLGVHDGEGLPAIVREGAVMPLRALESLFGDFTGFLTFRFTIDPVFNHDLAAAREEIEQYLTRPRYPWRERLAVNIWEQELRFGVASLEQHVLLLQLLIPIATVVSVIIAAGLTMLFMLQNAKNAAMIRVLGMSKGKAQFALWSWQMIPCIDGVAAGLLLSVILGLRANLAMVALPYFAGAVLGAAVGAVLITNRAPLDLLQVKE